MLYYLVKPAGRLAGRTHKVSRGAEIVEGPRDTAEELRDKLADARARGFTRAIASSESPRTKLKWVAGDTWMLTTLQAAKAKKQ
jgi:hypothetical protein